MLKKMRDGFMESRFLEKNLKRVLTFLSPIISGKDTEYGYSTSFSYRLLHPGVSGNKINGLGEKKSRRPFRILWTDGSETPFGSLQRLFLIISGMKGTVKYTDHLHTRELARKEKIQFHQIPTPPPNPMPINTLTDEVKKAALNAGGDIVGITPMRDEWVFDNTTLPDWAYDEYGNLTANLIVVGVEMDYDNFGQAPLLPAATEAMKQYDRGTESALGVAELLIQQGYHAWGHSGPRAGRFLLIPAAEEAGLGNLGKHGSLISREFGSSLRLGATLTNAKLLPNQKNHFGSEDFCVNCQICVRECPGDALQNDKQLIRGVEKYYVDFDKCLPHFMDKNGCGICAAKCPYSRPEVRPNLINKYLKRQQKQNSTKSIQ